MNRRTLLPVVIDVIAHVLNLLRHHVRAHGFMLASPNFYAGGPEVSGLRAESFKGNSVEVQQLREAKLELVLSVRKVLD